MEQDLLNWVSAVQSASIKHASEYTKSLESACYDYYQRSALMASVIEFAISLFSKFVVMNIDDIELADGVFDLLIGSSDAIGTALCSRFRPLVGKKYSTFWQGYFDDYRNVNPTEEAKNAYSKLRIATEELKREYLQRKHERILKENPDYDKDRIYRAAVEKKAHGDIKSLEVAATMFENIKDYKDSELLATETKERIKEEKYSVALEKKNADNIESLSEAATLFTENANYKDSDSLVIECKNRIEELTSLKKKKKGYLIAVAVAAVVIVALLLIFVAPINDING